MSQPTYTNLAQAAYTAYANDAHWKNFMGNPMPAWDDLPNIIRSHWMAAIIHVIDTQNSEK